MGSGSDPTRPNSGPLSKELLRLSEERFKLLVQGVRDYGIFMLDPQGIVSTWNEGAERIKGYTAQEIIGQHFSRFYPPEVAASGFPQHELAVATETGSFEDEGWRIRKDGSRFWANVVITALRDESGTLVGFAKVTRDLTERRRHEEELRDSEERFRLLIEGVRDHAIFMLDPDGRVSSWNEGARRVKGYTAEEILGRHFSVFYPPESRDRGWPDHELAVARRDGRFEDEGWRVRKDGTRFWANVVLSALHDTKGTLRGFAKITRDLTERRKVEELQAAGQQTREFLAMLGHELRNPLAPIRNAVAILRARGDGDEVLSNTSQVIARQLEHLGRIVDDLLDVGRITTGKVVVQRMPLDLSRLVSDCAHALQPTFDGRSQVVDVRTPAEPLWVEGDATRLSQVLSNLLGNASKYTPSGGHVSVDLLRDGPYAELRVRDDGEGIPGELLPRVFDLFTQGTRSLDRPQGGLGIGLTVVQKLVELHRGTVSASSGGPGKGSEFVVRLPLITPPAASVAPRRAAPAAAAAGVRVLVVDDNADSAETLALLVELWGHEVRMAGDGPAALAAVEAEPPDVMLLDIGLPGIDGYEVARRVQESHPGVYLVAMTGYGQAEDLKRGREAGFAEHLVKPVAPDVLEQLLRRRASAKG